MGDETHKSRSDTAAAFVALVDIVHKLRAPDGCPWDREQTPETLKPYVVEEAYEVLDAIDGGGPAELREELGDLLLQIVLQAEIASETGSFTVADVISGISDKLVARHPHVFGSVKVDGSSQVLSNWEQIKKKEKKGRGLFEGLPAQLPALQRAARMGEKAGRVGFDWTRAEAVRAKVAEELAELDEAVEGGDEGEVRHELGDFLFATAQWARHLGHQPEEALRACCHRFSNRFHEMERLASESGRGLGELGPDALDALWEQAKRDVAD